MSCVQYTGMIPDDLWKQVRPLLQDAANYSHGEFTPESVRLQLFQELQQLWVVFRDEKVMFVWITEIRRQAGRKVVIVYAAAGIMTYGWDFWPYMATWMKGNEIEEAEVYCRPSMARLLKRFGLNTRYEVLTITPDGGLE